MTQTPQIVYRDFHKCVWYDFYKNVCFSDFVCDSIAFYFRRTNFSHAAVNSGWTGLGRFVFVTCFILYTKQCQRTGTTLHRTQKSHSMENIIRFLLGFVCCEKQSVLFFPFLFTVRQTEIQKYKFKRQRSVFSIFIYLFFSIIQSSFVDSQRTMLIFESESMSATTKWIKSKKTGRFRLAITKYIYFRTCEHFADVNTKFPQLFSSVKSERENKTENKIKRNLKKLKSNETVSNVFFFRIYLNRKTRAMTSSIFLFLRSIYSP